MRFLFRPSSIDFRPKKKLGRQARIFRRTQVALLHIYRKMRRVSQPDEVSRSLLPTNGLEHLSQSLSCRARTACVSSSGNWAVSIGGQFSCASTSKCILLVLGCSSVEHWIQRMCEVSLENSGFVACFTHILRPVGQHESDASQQTGDMNGCFLFPCRNNFPEKPKPFA